MCKPSHPSANESIWARKTFTHPKVSATCFRHCRPEFSICHCCEERYHCINYECDYYRASGQSDCWSSQYKNRTTDHGSNPDHYYIQKGQGANQVVFLRTI